MNMPDEETLRRWALEEERNAQIAKRIVELRKETLEALSPTPWRKRFRNFWAALLRAIS